MEPSLVGSTEPDRRGYRQRADAGVSSASGALCELIGVIVSLRHARVSVIAAPVLGIALALGATQIAGATAARPRPLRCHASVSNSKPKDFTTVDVFVRTADFARVRTVAHFKTTNHAKVRKASAHGRATVPYLISDATPGFKVKVTVTVTKGNRSGRCATSFTPRHR